MMATLAFNGLITGLKMKREQHLTEKQITNARYVMNKEKQLHKNEKSNEENCYLYNQKRALILS